MPVRSPSHFTPLKRLMDLRRDNYVGANGVDYCPQEVESLIAQKQQRKGLEAVAEATKAERSMAAQAEQLGDSWAVDALIDGVAALSAQVELPAEILRALVHLQAKKIKQLAVPF